jgi:hypothetical protein
MTLMLGMWMQDADSISAGNTKWLMIFVGVVAFSMLVQACVFIGFVIGAAKTQKRVIAMVDEVHESVLPTVRSVQELVREMTPKLRIITDNLLETSHVVRSKAQELDVTLTDVNVKTRRQVAHVDALVTATLDATANLAAAVEKGIRVPVREISGVMNGLKAGIEVLVGRVKSFGGRGEY